MFPSRAWEQGCNRCVVLIVVNVIDRLAMAMGEWNRESGDGLRPVGGLLNECLVGGGKWAVWGNKISGLINRPILTELGKKFPENSAAPKDSTRLAHDCRTPLEPRSCGAIWVGTASDASKAVSPQDGFRPRFMMVVVALIDHSRVPNKLGRSQQYVVVVAASDTIYWCSRRFRTPPDG
jgi:hypothetical protein